jgi:hypothetical protein
MSRFNSCLNQEVKIYGVPLKGVVGGSGIAFFLTGTILVSMLVGMILCGIGFFFGIWLSKMWHIGKLQKALFWNFPICQFFRKRMILSYKKYFL